MSGPAVGVTSAATEPVSPVVGTGSSVPPVGVESSVLYDSGSSGLLPFLPAVANALGPGLCLAVFMDLNLCHVGHGDL